MKEILRYLSENFWPLTPEASQFILQNSDEKKVAAGDVLLKPGEVCKHVWFIRSGLLRAYQEHHDEERGTIKIIHNWFMTENDTATSVVSCFREIPSEEFIVAHENSVIFQMSKKNLFEAIRRFHCMAGLTLMIIINYYCDTRIVETFLRMKDAGSLQKHMLQEHGDLLSRLDEKVKHSFFGISDTKYRKVKSGRSTGKKPGPGKSQISPVKKKSSK